MWGCLVAELYADDLLIAILYHALETPQLKKEPRFSADREFLHNTFFLLKQTAPDLLKPFRFREKGFFRESAALDQALSNLEATQLLTRHNDSPRYYFVHDSLKEAFDDFVAPALRAAQVSAENIKKLADTFVNSESEYDPA